MAHPPEPLAPTDKILPTGLPIIDLFYSVILPIPPLIFTRVKKCEIWPNLAF